MPRQCRFDLGPRPAARQLHAESVVARQRGSAGGDDVADPRQPRERQRVGSGRRTDPHHLGEAAGHQAGLAVVAEPEAVGGARGDGHDVLERAAQLDAEDVAVDVQPEPTPAQPFGDAPGQRQVLCRDDRRGGQPLRDLGRQIRPRQGRDAFRGDPPAWAMTSLIRSSVPRSSPLTTDSRSASGARCGATRATTERRCRDGVAKITRSAVAMSAGSAVAMRSSGSSIPGSRRSFRCVRAISSAGPRGGTGGRRARASRRSPPGSSPTHPPQRPRPAARPSARPAGPGRARPSGGP